MSKLERINELISDTTIYHIISTRDKMLRFSFVGIVLLVCIFLFELWLISLVKNNIKILGKDIVRNATKRYFSLAWIGWILIVFGVAGIELVNLNSDFLATIMTKQMTFFVSFVFIFLGILVNYRTYCVYLSDSLRSKFQ